MTKFMRSILLVCAVALTGTAAAATKEEQRVADATDVVDQLLRIPEQSVPPSLLARAYGIAVIPSVVKAGFVLGVRHGKGVMVVRQADGTWSNPSFIKMTGGSIGWQAGAQSTDIILVFKTRRSVDGITKGKLTLGADASVAAGPVGRHTGVATDIQFQAEVYSYSRSRGLFAGIAVEGAGITIDKRANAAFYGTSSITAGEIFASGGNAAPRVANDFVQMLSVQTRRLAQQPAMASGVATPAGSAEPKPKVRTFGIGSPEDAPPEEGEFAQQY
jgi:lipid-binding SYLF domain-containing protein